MSTQDRWGEDNQRRDTQDSESSTSWLILAAALLLLLLIAGGGFVFFRAVHMRQFAAMEAEQAARLEYEIQAARAATALAEQEKVTHVKEVELEKQLREVAKIQFFPNQGDAIQTGNELLALMSRQPDPKTIEAFVDREAVFYGVRSTPTDGDELMIGDNIRLLVRLAPTKSDLPQPVGSKVIVIGKLLRINPEAKTITIEVKHENWKVHATR